MTETAPPGPAPAHRSRRRTRVARRPSVIGVLGELLITAGALVLLFLAWQIWWNDMVMAAAQSGAAAEISREWIEEEVGTEAAATSPAEPAPLGYGDPIVAGAPARAEPFAVLFVPRFGSDYRRTIAEGTGLDVLNSEQLGVGHYPGTQMPGEVGNFAIAAHRSAYGGGMHLINEFQAGDPIYVQTADGYYTYRFRDLDYVPPSAVEVLAPVPNAPGVTPTDRIITLTSCNPLYSTAERIIAYGVFESWQPISAGPPADLAPLVSARAEG